MRPLILIDRDNGRFNHVPLMNGNTADETNFGLANTEYFSNTDKALRTPPTAEQYLNYVNTTYARPAYPDGTAAKVLAVYPLSAFKSPQLAWDRVGTDSGICNQRRLDKILAPQIPVYAYEFADKTAPIYFPDMPGMEALAYWFRGRAAGVCRTPVARSLTMSKGTEVVGFAFHAIRSFGQGASVPRVPVALHLGPCPAHRVRPRRGGLRGAA